MKETSPDPTLLAEYKKLAKRADQRMVRLEQAAKRDGEMSAATEYSYRKAKRDAEYYSAGKSKRFNAQTPKTNKALKAKINAINDFLESPTSTVRGIKNIYKKRADSLNASYGTNFKWQELADFFNSATWKKLISEIPSDLVMKAFARLQRGGKKLIQEIKENPSKQIADDEIQDFIIKRIIKEGITVDDFKQSR
jgi:hypothetical protein